MSTSRTSRTSRTHTHTGHCQACAHVHAVGITSGEIAKHGYTTRFGFFMGTCSGAGHPALEVSRAYADEMIARLEAFAVEQVDRAKALRAGTIKLDTIETGRSKRNSAGGIMRDRNLRAIPETCSWEMGSDVMRAAAIDGAVRVANENARGARSHAAYLVKFIPTIFGKPLISVAPVDAVADAPLAVGDTVRVWGKTGFDAVCIALRMATCHGQGPSLNGSVVMHAVFKRPSGTSEIAIPVRKIRRTAIVKRAVQS
jgi:hypothetical protein